MPSPSRWQGNRRASDAARIYTRVYIRWAMAHIWCTGRAPDLESTVETIPRTLDHTRNSSDAMAKREWMLTDTSTGTYARSFAIGPSDVPGTADGFSVTRKTLEGGLRHGVELLEVDTGSSQLSIVPTRGMGIWKASIGGVPLEWKSPIRGPVHPAFVPLSDPSGLGWLDGFDETLVRCGLRSNGAPDFDSRGQLVYPLHGTIANRPAHVLRVSVDGDTGQIQVTGVVDESRFLFQKLRLTSTITTRTGEHGFRVNDVVTNVSGQQAEIQLLYHFNVGPPLLGAGSRLVAPVQAVVPRDDVAARAIDSWDVYAAPRSGFAEQVFFLDLLPDRNGQTPVLLKNAPGTKGVCIHFDRSALPWFTLWKNTAAHADGYVTGLEPATNLPNPRSYEGRQGRVVTIGPGQSVAMQIDVRVQINASEIARVEQAIAAIQKDVPRHAYPQPQPGWSPAGEDQQKRGS